MKHISLITLILLSTNLWSQEIPMASYEARNQQTESSVFSGLKARNIGPVVQGGRVTDIEVPAGQTELYYVAFASGGIFKTTDNGQTFQPIFDNVDALGIGDMALAPSNPEIIYAGTGEKNSSRSSYAGSGVYKSLDGGKSWESVGLEQTHHIGRVLVHPTDPRTVWVASLGALYSNNPDRGVYKSTDGGQTWRKTLFINDSTGIVDLVINPENPDELLASAWERTRSAWNFKGNGPGSGIYRSEDGGESWVQVDGFPRNDGIGRIGLAASASVPSRYYALLDNQNTRKTSDEEEEDDSLTFEQLGDMSDSDFAAIDDKALESFLRDNNFPEKYTATTVRAGIESGRYTVKDISAYYGDANNALFDTEVLGAELYRSDDHGVSWEKVNSYDLEGVYFTYGYYFGEVRVAPDNADLVYIFGVPLLKSTDGGVHYARIDTMNDVHVDHQSLWINPKNSKHLRLGNDGGLYESFDEGGHWRHLNNMSVGQFYTVNYDFEEPYNVYGGLQDNGTLAGPSTSVPNRTPFWEELFGGDGMFVAPDPRDASVVYVGFQFGNYFRLDRKSGQRARLQPRHDIGDDVPRYNWRTPLILSEHNPDIVYMASQRVYRSMNQGEDWAAISGDLTTNRAQGNVPFSTVSTLAESPLEFGRLYAGTDDGNVYVTTGSDWKNISGGLPKGKWVSQVSTSPHDVSTAFVALNGYREDDFSAYLFKTADNGLTWTSIRGNLPEVVINSVIEDDKVPGLLYVGTDFGLYISRDGGKSYEIAGSVPNVAVYDLKVQPKAEELIIGTHGRSIYVMDVKSLRAYASDPDNVYLDGPESIRHSDSWGERRYPYVDPSEPGIAYSYYVAPGSEVTIRVKNSDGETFFEQKDVKAGFGSWRWNGKGSGDFKDDYLSEGEYVVELIKGKVNGKNPQGDGSATSTLKVR